MTTSLTLTHLRFDLVARTAVHLGRYEAGERLRNALASVMLRATCPQTHRAAKPSPEHAAVCPACWLLAAEVDPGSVVRAYSLVPPLYQGGRDWGIGAVHYQASPPLLLPANQGVVEAGQCFSFVLTLFGNGLDYLPYFVLAAAEMGRVGVGPGRGREGLGRFAIETIYAGDPLTGRWEVVLAAGDSLVHVPEVAVSWEGVQVASGKWQVAKDDEVTRWQGDKVTQRDCHPLTPSPPHPVTVSPPHAGDLTLHFLTPTRLEEGDKRPIRTADFGIFFRRLLYRIDDLGRQLAGQSRRPAEEIQTLYALADQVRLVDSRTRWIELWSWSGRKQQETPTGGFVGTATFRAQDWRPFLPWLILGQATQVGKLAIKGNGVYELAIPGQVGYWQWLMTSS